MEEDVYTKLTEEIVSHEDLSDKLKIRLCVMIQQAMADGYNRGKCGRDLHDIWAVYDPNIHEIIGTTTNIKLAEQDEPGCYYIPITEAEALAISDDNLNREIARQIIRRYKG